ncbi:hypothetical protein AgCh_011456 [Apium graveolens]
MASDMVSHPQFKHQNHSKFQDLTQHNYKQELQTAKGSTNYCTKCRLSYRGESKEPFVLTLTLSILFKINELSREERPHVSFSL